MSKAYEYMKHSQVMQFENLQATAWADTPLRARVLTDGTLLIRMPSDMGMMATGIKPDVALAFGKWIVEMFEGSELSGER